MGVKSTCTLSRSQAIARLVQFKLDAYERKLLAEFAEYTNEQLEDSLEIANDAHFRREYNIASGFDNYCIEGD